MDSPHLLTMTTDHWKYLTEFLSNRSQVLLKEVIFDRLNIPVNIELSDYEDYEKVSRSKYYPLCKSICVEKLTGYDKDRPISFPKNIHPKNVKFILDMNALPCIKIRVNFSNTNVYVGSGLWKGSSGTSVYANHPTVIKADNIIVTDSNNRNSVVPPRRYAFRGISDLTFSKDAYYS